MASKTTKMPTADRKPTASGVTGEETDTQRHIDQMLEVQFVLLISSVR